MSAAPEAAPQCQSAPAAFGLQTTRERCAAGPAKPSCAVTAGTVRGAVGPRIPHAKAAQAGQEAAPPFEAVSFAGATKPVLFTRKPHSLELPASAGRGVEEPPPSSAAAQKE